MPATGSDPPEHIRVEVDELAGALPLVPDDRWTRLEAVEPTESLPTEDRVDGAVCRPRLPGEDVRSDAEARAGGRTAARRALPGAGEPVAVDGARAVDQTGRALPSEPADPLRAGLSADASSVGRLRDRPATTDAQGEDDHDDRDQRRQCVYRSVHPVAVREAMKVVENPPVSSATHAWTGGVVDAVP